jgi:prevent-host-death family protein
MSKSLRPRKLRSSRAEWTLTKAKAQLSDVVQRALDGEPQRVVRHGREAVIIVAAETYESSVRPKRSLVDLFSALRGCDIEIDRPHEDAREVPIF